MSRLLVIGGASIDMLHLADRTVTCAGGAGAYTAMAVCPCGAQVALFGPRPDPCPEELKPVVARLAHWLGSHIPPAQLPQFEISYHGAKTDYLQASLEAETMLSPSLLPADLSEYDLVHVAPLGDPRTQLPFVQACRGRGARRISAGTGSSIADKQPQAVRAVMELADYFFLKDLEAEAVFASLGSAHTKPGKAAIEPESRSIAGDL